MIPARPSDAPEPSPEAIEFVRFCYRRRRVGWPELYDEMCAVAGRGLYRGWRFAELEERGIGFSLHQTLDLARIAGQVAVEEGDRRGRVTGRTGGRAAEPAVGTPVVADAESAPVAVAAEPFLDVPIRLAAAVQSETAIGTGSGAGPRPEPVAIPPQPASSPARPALAPSLIRSAAGAG